MIAMTRPTSWSPVGGVPGSQQLRIPTPQDLERMRKFRQQQRQQQQQQQQARRPLPQMPPLPQQAPGEQAPAGQQLQQLQQQRLQHQQQQLQHQQLQQLQQQQQLARQRQGQRQTRPSSSSDLFATLADECDLSDAWRPQVLLLYELGLRVPDFHKLTEARPEIFQMGIVTMRRKLKFLQDTIGLSNEELRKVIVKFPRILEYKSERTIRPRLEFLRRCGVTQSDLGKVFVRAPMAMELRVKDTLEPRAMYLRDVLQLPSEALGKLIVRHPQVLTCTEDMMQQRVEFLLQQGLNPAEVGRAVLAHPQVLHYKIDSMQERVDYLLSIGLDQTQVAASICRFPQLFSLNVEANIAPKWRYLCDYIHTPAGSVAALCSYPAYFSLSLSNRICPRHRYFLHVQAQKIGGNSRSSHRGSRPAEVPFPMGHLKCSDSAFAKLCGTTLAEYEQFRLQLFGGPAVPG